MENLNILEKKLDDISLDDSETLHGSSNPSRTSTVDLVAYAPSKTFESIKKSAPFKQKIPECLSDDSDDTIGSESGSDGEPISTEDLMKCTKHVQTLLRRIESLQDLVSEVKPARRSKRRVHKAYRRFCSKIENEILREPTVPDIFYPPHKDDEDSQISDSSRNFAKSPTLPSAHSLVTRDLPLAPENENHQPAGNQPATLDTNGKRQLPQAAQKGNAENLLVSPALKPKILPNIKPLISQGGKAISPTFCPPDQITTILTCD